MANSETTRFRTLAEEEAHGILTGYGWTCIPPVPPAPKIELAEGQKWFPKKPTVKPRQIVWIGRDDCYGHGAVRWRNPYPWGDETTSIMQGRAFLQWIKKHGAILP